MEALVRELEAALIPVNRGAAKRSLSRLHRETTRALESGRVDVDAEIQASAERREAEVDPPPPAGFEVAYRAGSAQASPPGAPQHYAAPQHAAPQRYDSRQYYDAPQHYDAPGLLQQPPAVAPVSMVAPPAAPAQPQRLQPQPAPLAQLPSVSAASALPGQRHQQYEQCSPSYTPLPAQTWDVADSEVEEEWFTPPAEERSDPVTPVEPVIQRALSRPPPAPEDPHRTPYLGTVVAPVPRAAFERRPADEPPGDATDPAPFSEVIP
jgi:hypothetical protein